MAGLYRLLILLQIDSTRASPLTASDKITIISIIISMITILLAVKVKGIAKYLKRVSSNTMIKFDKSNARIIERYVNYFLTTREGMGYCLTHKATNARQEKLENKIKDSLLKLRKMKAISEIQNDVYYFYLFS